MCEELEGVGGKVQGSVLSVASLFELYGPYFFYCRNW